jgi:hypothetical protein
MITPSYSATATERVLPRMALDFTTGVLDPRVSVVRALNTATRVNSSGLIEGVNADLPRFDYNPVTLAPRGLLIEELRTNLLTRSEEFETGNWGKVNLSTTANTTTAPSGALTADSIIENTAVNAYHQTSQTFTSTAATTYSFSVFLKANGRDTATMMLGAGVNFVFFAFNLTTATVGAVQYAGSTWSNGTASITNFGNGWYRCVISGLVSNAASYNAVVEINEGANRQYTGNGTSGLFVWGAQLEAGAFATSYIPTVASQVTRNADVVSMTGTNFSDWYNASEGALQVNATAISASQYVSAAAIYLDANNYIAFSFGDLNKPRLLIRNAGTFEVNTTASAAQTNPFNQCAAYKSGSISFASNTTLIVNSVNKPIPSGLTALYIGSNPALGATGFSNAWLTKVNYWPQRLINNEVISVSK